MSLISLLIIVIVLALVCWIFVAYVAPALPPPFRTVAIAIFGLIIILILLSYIGIIPAGNIRIR